MRINNITESSEESFQPKFQRHGQADLQKQSISNVFILQIPFRKCPPLLLSNIKINDFCFFIETKFFSRGVRVTKDLRINGLLRAVCSLWELKWVNNDCKQAARLLTQAATRGLGNGAPHEKLKERLKGLNLAASDSDVEKRGREKKWEYEWNK